MIELIDIISPMIKDFLPFAQKHMGFEKPPRLFLKGDAQNADNPLGKTAFYSPEQKSVTIYTTGRHPKDIMRSLSHELVHHSQNCRGDFENVGEMGEGYAQSDEHLREMEREAYEIGNMCFRDWEDGIKSTIYFEQLQKGVTSSMSTKEWKNGELRSLLAEAWGFGFTLDGLNEGSDQSGVEGAEEDVEGKASGWNDDEDNLEEGDTGASAGDESETHPGEKDYTTKKDDDTEEDEKAYVNEGDAPKGHGPNTKAGKWDRSDVANKVPKGFVNEDSGEEEGEHYRDNEMSDEDHIKAIEHHLAALRHDRDHDEDHIDERATNPEHKKPGRKYTQPDGQRVTAESKISETRLRKIIRRALKEKVRRG